MYQLCSNALQCYIDCVHVFHENHCRHTEKMISELDRSPIHFTSSSQKRNINCIYEKCKTTFTLELLTTAEEKGSLLRLEASGLI